MLTAFENLASNVFHQLYDHTIGWYADWLDDDVEQLAKTLAVDAGLSDEAREWLPWGVTKAAVIAAGAELLLQEQIAMARVEGKSWRDIAACLGVHASAAHRRWGPRVAARVEQEEQRRREWVARRH